MHEIRAFLRREEADRDGHQVEGARACRAQEGSQFRTYELNRIEVRTVGREEPEVRARALNGRVHRGLLCTTRLSSTTTSPGRNAGTSTCSTEARNVGLSIGPSNTAGAYSPSSRRAAITAWVCQ